MSVALAREALPEVAPRPVVHKFGGSSLADAASIRQAAAIVANEVVSPCYVVVSAAYGTTDALLDCLREAAQGGSWRRSFARLRRRQTGLIAGVASAAEARGLHAALHTDFVALGKLLAAVELLHAASSEADDAVAAYGELWSMRLFAALLRGRGLGAETLDARRFLCARKVGVETEVDWAASAALFERIAAETRSDVRVVPGFVARCAERGITLTLGRNGSDWSATILARLAGADTVTIWSDVPGVLDGDPDVVGEASTQDRLGFEAAHMLAEHGARILHPSTLAPLDGSDVKLHVKCTFTPNGGATCLDVRAPAPTAIVSAHGDTVSAIGSGVRAAEAFGALARAGISPGSGEAIADRVSVRLEPAELCRAQRIWHRRLCRHQPRADLFLIGVGHVGGAFLDALGAREDDGLHLLGVANSKHLSGWKGPVSCARSRRLLRTSEVESDAALFAEFVLARCEGAPVIVDATASTEIARAHARWLEAGIHVVTANKLAAAEGWVGDAQRERAFYGDAATVGAGLPILQSLRRLRDAGDRIESVEGIFSGSLAFLFDAIEHGRSLASALAAACRAGYAEPDPRADLSGMDAARKLAIVADAAGISAGIAPPEPAVPAQALELDADALRRELPALGLDLKRAAREAGKRKAALRYVASLTAAGDNHIGPRAVPRDEALAGTRGIENIAIIRSRSYTKHPLVIRGPGAGPEVTARALLADLAEVLARHG
ncbi:MAG: hypothetical protein ACRESR_05440 [Gammaproteobacteria bacterium]